MHTGTQSPLKTYLGVWIADPHDAERIMYDENATEMSVEGEELPTHRIVIDDRLTGDKLLCIKAGLVALRAGGAVELTEDSAWQLGLDPRSVVNRFCFVGPSTYVLLYAHTEDEASDAVTRIMAGYLQEQRGEEMLA